MGRIIVFNRVSADGYFAAVDGDLGWAVQDEELDRMAAASLGRADTLLFGRRTYEMFERFWPAAIREASGPGPHGERQLSAEGRAMGAWIDGATKWVFSRTREEVSWAGSQIHREVDPREIEALKRESGKDILIFGSGSIVTRLTELGLIDAYELVVTPVFLGRGKTMIESLRASRRLTLTEARAFRSGNALLRYDAA